MLSSSTKKALPPPPSLPSSMEPRQYNHSATTTTTTTSSSSSHSSSSQILTQKVHNAISLNTTASSFATALDALSTLQSPTTTTTTATTTTGKLDSKSIRTAIEQDALYHAKCLQDEMKRLVHTVQDMRCSIQNVIKIAEGVKGSMTAMVVVSQDGSGSGIGSGIGDDVNGGSGDNNNNNHKIHASSKSSVTSEALEQEKKLAEFIANAFQERNEARMRYQSLLEFLKKYNLEEKDSILLENFNLETIALDPSSISTLTSTSTSSSSSIDGECSIRKGMEFLNALERISMIRKKLSSSSSSSSLTLTGSVGRTKDKDSTIHNRPLVLGPASTMRLVENLASKQERAFERLYHFLHLRLDLAARSSSTTTTTSASTSTSSNLQLQDEMDETLLHPFIQRAMYVLRQVPAYYRHTVELIASSRRAEVTRKFLLALTSGYDGMAPMEMKAHDPVNYVGDMLAFVFRTLSVESELAKGLFFVVVVGGKQQEEMPVGGEEGSVEKDGDLGEGVVKAVEDEKENEDEDEDEDEDVDREQEDVEEYARLTAMDVLNDVMSGVARPLKSRLSHILVSLSTRPEEEHGGGENDDHLVLMGGLHNEEEAGMARNRLASLYSICGLLLFYQSAMEKALGKLEKMNLTGGKASVEGAAGAVFRNQMNPLVICLRECLSEGAKGFMASVKVYVATLESLAASSSDSTTTAATTQVAVASEMIVRLCQVRGASPGFGIVTEHMDEETKHGLCVEFLCDHVFEPVFPLCTNLDDVIAMKAALASMNKVGLESGHASKWQSACAEKEKMLIDVQIESDVKDFLHESGLGGICSAMENLEAMYVEGMIASSHPGMSQESLRKAVEIFYATLYDPPIPSYVGVKDPALKKYAKNKVVEIVTAVYEKIYDLARGEKGGYADLSFFKYDSLQVKAMLSS
jgi:hypothetical protein